MLLLPLLYACGGGNRAQPAAAAQPADEPPGAGTGTEVRGTVRDSATGAPLADALLSVGPVVFGTGNGGTFTDARGRFHVRDVRGPEAEFQLRCPSLTGFRGKEILVRRLRVPPAPGPAVMDVRVDAALCDEPPFRALRGEFWGRYTVGFEEDRFVPCVDTARGIRPPFDEDLGFSEVEASVVFASPAAEEQQRRAGWLEPEVRYALPARRYFVRWRGTLSGPGRYGLNGLRTHEMAVDTVLTVVPGDNGGMCAYPPDRPPR